MGNTPTKDKQFYDMYSSYIKQQQDLIFKQQEQINSLYQLNIHNHQQSIPPNLLFQQDVNPQTTPDVPKLPSDKKYKLDPYKILNIPKQYDEKTLKRAYLKAAMKTHPDRGGSKNEFQKVSIAYTLLTKKLKESKDSHGHNDLKGLAKDFYTEQSNQPKVNINMSDNFDVDLFNKIYEDNKIPDAFNDGYGSWMNDTPQKDISQPKMFQDGFNKDLFNQTFETYKNEQTKKKGDQIVQYKEPEQRLSMSNQDSLVVLGQDKISDFGGTTDNLSFTDYKQAFTDGSTLIDVRTVDISDRANSINSIKSQRSNISHSMSSRDQQLYSLQQLEQQKAEENRLQRLQKTDHQHKMTYDKIHSLLLR